VTSAMHDGPALALHLDRCVNMKLFDKIICAVDFDESSTVVLHFARELAEQNGATLSCCTSRCYR
jgi:hypothetical protein